MKQPTEPLPPNVTVRRADPADVAKCGDFIQLRGAVFKVTKVGKKTLTLRAEPMPYLDSPPVAPEPAAPEA